MYKFLLKPLLFLLAPEKAHAYTVSLLKLVLTIPFVKSIFRWYYSVKHPALRQKIVDLLFENPVGLAAGFDKDGKYYAAMSVLGFGFIELGTVTPKPQQGNPKPRLFRLPADKGLINRMGFNNEGVDALVERLRSSRPSGLVIGGNIGKNKTTPNTQAINDYKYCFERLHPHVDYFVVNVSSPNTPNLRALQEKEPLTKLLQELQRINECYAVTKPIFLKIAPDLSFQQLDDIIAIVQACNLAGVIATNTTISREGLRSETEEVTAIGNGGLSGKPLSKRATAIVQYLHKQSNGGFVIIASGGVHSVADALEKLAAGATLVQVYTGLIYEGPGLVKAINKAIVAKSILKFDD